MKQKGFALLTAVIILVLFSLMGAYIINIASMARYTSSGSYRAGQALYAAKSGLEWGIFQVNTYSDNCFSPKTIVLNQGSLKNFTSTVTCSKQSYFEGIKQFNVFNLTAIGYQGIYGQMDYVSRQVSIIVTKGL